MLIEAKAKQVGQDLINSEGISGDVGLSPAMILAIIQIIGEVIQISKTCNKTGFFLQRLSRNPGFLNRFWLKTVTHAKLVEVQLEEYTNAVYNSVLRVGLSTTEPEYSQLLEGK